MFRRATPVATRCSIERHKVGEPHFDFLGPTPHHSQVTAMVEQSERNALACRRATGLEDFQPDALAPGLFNKGAYRGFQFLLVRGTGIQRLRCAVPGRQVKPSLVDVNGHNGRPHGGSDLYAESTDSSHAHKYSHVLRS